jgi:Na+-driven multidrug efflux pump
MIPGGLCYSWQICYMKFLAGQRITIIGMYANITASCVHFILAPILVIYFELGVPGVAFSSSLQFIVRFLICMGYANYGKEFKNPEIQVPVLSYHEDNFKDWKDQFILNFQAMSLSVWSWWAMDIFTVISSYMSVGILTA